MNEMKERALMYLKGLNRLVKVWLVVTITIQSNKV